MPSLRSQSKSLIVSTSRRPKTPVVVQPQKIKVKTPNIPTVLETPAPMSSHLDNPRLNKRKNWPATAFYENIKYVTCGSDLRDTTKQAINEGIEKKNQCTCNCGPKVDCSTNPKCACYKAAMAMKEAFQHESLYTTECPLPFEGTAFDKFYREPVFQCGDGCACSNRHCKLNALRRMDEHKFTIERHDVGKGFCVYTQKQVNKGDAIMPFNGELTGYMGIRPDSDSEQYSIILLDGKPEKELAKVLATKMPMIDKPYADLLRRTYAGSKVFINPLKKGNVARFLSHGCKSTIFLARVFQGGFSPANLRIIMMAGDMIRATHELTFDYGNQYLNAHLPACLCDWCKAHPKQKKEGRKIKKRPLPKENEDDEIQQIVEIVEREETVEREAVESTSRPVGRTRKIKEEPVSQPPTPPPQPRARRMRVTIKEEPVEMEDTAPSTSNSRTLRARSQSVRREVRSVSIKPEPIDDYEEEEAHRHPTMALRRVVRSRLNSQRAEPVVRTSGAQTRYQTRVHGQPPEELFGPMRHRRAASVMRATSVLRSVPINTRRLARLQSVPPNY